ncbi:unnamed protein product [Rotaria magnacalcarata]|uniref:Uncharacterized protein n=1 Tax=Rotaria magnacalcarata TaxID=392030 RepID=A0A816SRI5_9BILA|nr:unnamed protein product [Rotaria magnacalcarata]CAF4213997.1 unnamed protein product [Rotaria magnacalcarata]
MECTWPKLFTPANVKAELVDDKDSCDNSLSIYKSSADDISSPRNMNMPLYNEKPCFTENFVAVLLKSNSNECDDNIYNSIFDFLLIINSNKAFTDYNQCIDFICHVQNKKIFLIVSSDLEERVIPIVRDFAQLQSIYVFCDNNSQHEQLIKKHRKVKGFFTEIERISHALRQDIQHYSNALIRISIIPPASINNLDELDQSFMYSQLLKEVFLETPHDDNDKKHFVNFCRIYYVKNNKEFQKLDEFERDYKHLSPIWWYSREYFIFAILNEALRNQDINIILKMGFFLRDLHCQIEQLHSKADYHKPFTVYRGQGVSQVEFEKLQKSQGGLLSFNNFLSTSTAYQVSFLFAEAACSNPDLVGILFQIEVNPSIISTPFALIDDISHFNNIEKEILFSMHTIFRICDLEPIQDRLWCVYLTLTSDNDQELMILTEYIRQEILGPSGLYRLGHLMDKMGEFNKAEEIYMTLLSKTSNDDIDQVAYLNSQIGCVKVAKGDLESAVSYFEKALEIQEKSCPLHYPCLARAYNDIGAVSYLMGEYSKAFSYYEKILQIHQNSLSSDDLHLSVSYNNIATLCKLAGN